MANLKSVPLKQQKAKQEKAVKGEYLQAAVHHMDEMHDPLYRLEGLLHVMSSRAPQGDGADPESLNGTFSVLLDLVAEVKKYHDGFWDNYLLATGQKVEDPKSEKGA